MNKFKLISGVILLFFAGILAGALGSGIYFKQRVERFSGPGPQVPVRVQILAGKFSKELDLTRDQRNEIEKIVEDSQEQILALGREMLPDIEEINEQSWELVKAELNDKQKEKLDELYQRMRGFRDMGPLQPYETRGKRGAPANGDMKERLNLTEEQAEKVRTITEEIEKEKEEIQKKYREQDPQDYLSLGNEMRELDKVYEDRLGEVLTEEQMKQYLESTREEDRTDKSPRTQEGKRLGMSEDGGMSPGGPEEGRQPGMPEGRMMTPGTSPAPNGGGILSNVPDVNRSPI
jgi:Spy/CpxP family protein refolding chaperone